MMRARAVVVVGLVLVTSLAHGRGRAQEAEAERTVPSDTATGPSRPTTTSGSRGAEGRAEASPEEPWIVGLIVGAIVGVGVGVAIAVIASQQSLEPPIPGTEGAVELLRF